VTSEGARLLVAAVKALGGCPDPRELMLVREALLRGPADLAGDLRLAMFGESQESLATFKRLADVVSAGGGSPFTLLDLCTTEDPRRKSGGRRELRAAASA
jgi:hypothetical protein